MKRKQTKQITMGGERLRQSRRPPILHSIPTFTEWLKYTWLDIFTMSVVGAIGIGVRPWPWRLSAFAS